MASLADVFRVLDEMKSAGVIGDYAVGGGMAALFYVEAVATYDIDVFALIPSPTGLTIRLTEIYEWCKKRGFEAEAEHVLIHTVPVQFLAANEGVENEAVEHARTFVYEGVPVRVLEPEYLAILSVLAGGPKRRQRAGLLFEAGIIDREKLRGILERHALLNRWREMGGDNV